MLRLELESFPVRDAGFGRRTEWRDGYLELNHDELLELARADPRVGWASVDLARPGESVRVLNVNDFWVPMAKLDGAGQTYPAICGRPTAPVGQGRTRRLSGLTVVECGPVRSPADNPAMHAHGSDNIPRGNFLDLSGPGAAVPYGSLVNLCITLERVPSVGDEDWEEARKAVCLRICDRLAAATLGQAAPERELFDTTSRNPALPGVVHVTMLMSTEAYVGPRSGIGIAIYGLTRHSMPWLLQPTEVLDGAITRGPTWYQVNNPIVLHLLRGHGKQWNFLGVIVGSTNWTAMREKEIVAHRIGDLARSLGARGAIVTVNHRGARFVETVLAVQELERAGVRSVLVTLEEANEGGASPPLLLAVPELVAVVSSGDGSIPGGDFPAVERVIGAREARPDDYAARPGVSAGYGNARYWIDYYGLGHASGFDY